MAHNLERTNGGKVLRFQESPQLKDQYDKYRILDWYANAIKMLGYHTDHDSIGDTRRHIDIFRERVAEGKFSVFNITPKILQELDDLLGANNLNF